MDKELFQMAWQIDTDIYRCISYTRYIDILDIYISIARMKEKLIACIQINNRVCYM